MATRPLCPPVVVHAEEDGRPEAPPLLLSHPLGADLRIWQPLITPLARSFRVITYDQRGHGASPSPAGPYSIDQLGSDALALLDRLGLERVNVAGVSLGGMVGLWLAVHAPERLDRLVVCSASAWLGDPAAWTDRASIVRQNGTVAIADGTVHRWVGPRFAEQHPDLIDRLIARFVGTTDEGYAACCEALGDLDLRADLSRILTPTLVLAGRDDAAIPLAHAEYLADNIPTADLAIIEDAGHFAPLEQGRAFLDHLGTHLNRTMFEPA
jgi:3-oxoadipate enol-lactonase